VLKLSENAKFHAEFDTVEKNAKNIHPIEVIGQKLLHTVIKEKNPFYM
jgi:hypothetical protein